MLAPNTILQLLKNDALPEYAKEKKSFLEKIFSSKDWYKTTDLWRRAITRIGQYSSQLLEKQLLSLIKEPKSLFNLTTEGYHSYEETYKDLILNNSYWVEVIHSYIKNNRLTGLDYRFVRYLLFFAAFRKDLPNVSVLRTLVGKFPEAYQLEVSIILLLGRLKSENIQGTFEDFLHYRWSNPTIKEAYDTYNDWFHNFLLPENSASTKKAMQLFDLSEKETEALCENGSWAKFEATPLADFDYYQTLKNASDWVILEFCKLTFIRQYPNFNSKFDTKTLHKFLEKINWTEEMLVNFIAFATQINTLNKLPTPILKAAEKFLQQNATHILDALWKYYSKTKKHNQIEDKAVLELLQTYSSIRVATMQASAPFDKIIASGFDPIRPSYTQNIYKGMIPEQVRPFFQLMREVGNVDIVKFYQDGQKNHFVRFQINGNQYDLPTTNGLGLTIIQPLNTLLFENNIPYQFVVFMRNGRVSNIQFTNINWHDAGVTLVNQACYEPFSQYFMNSPITGFAETNQPPVAFTKRIEEIKQITLRTDLDQIDLQSDPKFTILRTELDKLPNLAVWTELLTHSLRYPIDAKPSKTWQNNAKELVEKLGEEAFQNGHVLILEKLIASDEWFQDTEKLCVLRGLTWLSQLHPGSGQLYQLQKIANKSYKKVPGGPLNAKLGNIALETLADIGNLDALGIVNNIEAKAKYPVYKRAIAARKKKFTKLLKEFSPEDLADRSVSNHQLVDGKKSMQVGNCKALFELDGFAVTTTWETENGKVQKSVPTHLKADFAGELKAVSAEAKSILETLKAQAHNLEKSWLQQRTWSFANWQEFLMNHGLMQVMTERLIWIMMVGRKSTSFILKNGQPVDCQGNTIELNPDSTLRLWHPALASVEETLAWRNRLFDWTIKQPFKQAFREVYLLTPAEEGTFDHSNRFAGHHLKGNTLYSLGKTREWTMTYEDAPILKLPGGELVAVLNIRGGVLYSECQTLDLHFKKIDPNQTTYGYYGREKVALSDVPPVVLSEVMRDVDLFVAVAGLGVDPYFDQNQTGEPMNYWREASFGKKSQTALSDIRKDLLSRLLPMTKIAQKCSFEGNFLKVKGSLRDYKINLGSGNILMEPNDQYLCIVPGRNPSFEKKIWLPFEGGDQTLMVILSKAFLLVEDAKIKDSSILVQINRR